MSSSSSAAVPSVKGTAEFRNAAQVPRSKEGRYGFGSELTRIRSWLSICLLDANGVIRYHGLRSQDLAQAVSKLLSE